jgi:hypothetical protein
MMSAHKITVGHGYKYPTSQVAAQDASAMPPGGLGAYYSEGGETRTVDGQQARRACLGRRAKPDGGPFRAGCHPEAARIEEQLRVDDGLCRGPALHGGNPARAGLLDACVAFRESRFSSSNRRRARSRAALSAVSRAPIGHASLGIWSDTAAPPS